MVWIVKKGISCFLILLGVTFVTFALMYLAGGDAISYFYENQGTAVSQEIMDAMRKKYGLDQPFLMQYGHWLLHALMGDMGESYVSGRAVLPFIASKIPHTLYLAAVSIALTLVVSIPLGVLSAVRKDGWCDSLAGGLSFLGNAMPNFFCRDPSDLSAGCEAQVVPRRICGDVAFGRIAGSNACDRYECQVYATDPRGRTGRASKGLRDGGESTRGE